MRELEDPVLPEATTDPRGTPGSAQLEPSSAAMREADDFALMRAIAVDRDREALRALYDRHSPTVHALCLRILRDPSDAEEVLVDVFFELWDRAGRFDATRGRPLAYLVQLARSRAIDRLRRRVATTTSITPSGDRAKLVELSTKDTNVAATNTAPDAKAAVAEERDIVVRALNELEPGQRQAIECAYYEGLSHAQIAERLNRPVGTVKTWIRQGLMRLRDALSRRSAAPGDESA